MPIRRILRRALPLTGLELLGVVLALLTVPFLMRRLGPHGFGEYTFGLALAGVLSLVLEFGFNHYGARAVAQAGDAAKDWPSLYWTIQAGRCCVAVVSLPIAVLVLHFVGLAQSYLQVVAPALVLAIANLPLPTWFLQGSQRTDLLAATLALARLGTALSLLALINGPQDVALAIWIQAGISLGAALICLLWLHRGAQLHWQRPRLLEVRLHLRRAAPLFAASAATSLYGNGVPLLLGLLSSPVSVGLYGAADRIRTAAQILLAPLGQVAFPVLSKAFQQEEARGFAQARRLLHLQLLLCGGASALLIFGAGPLLNHWGMGRFDDATPILQVLALCVLLTGVSNTVGIQIMLPRKQEREFLRTLLLGAGFGLLLLVPAAFWAGGLGAAIAVLASESLVTLLMLRWLNREPERT